MSSLLSKLINLGGQLTGTLGIGNGGTGQTTATAAMDALSPLTTKGDVVVYNGTHNVRQAVGTDGQIFVSDSTQASGVNWVGTNWTSFTPTSTGLGTLASVTAQWRRQGPEMIVLVRATTGTVTASTASITIPNSQAIDTGVVSNTAGVSTVAGQLSIGGGSTNTVVLQPATSGTLIYFAVYSSIDTLVSGASFGSSTAFSFRCSIPISGWK